MQNYSQYGSLDGFLWEARLSLKQGFIKYLYVNLIAKVALYKGKTLNKTQ
jgi:hypothetical protein